MHSKTGSPWQNFKAREFWAYSAILVVALPRISGISDLQLLLVTRVLLTLVLKLSYLITGRVY